jgi:predicted Fe-S protein YdhL (DUF1289 family)
MSSDAERTDSNYITTFTGNRFWPLAPRIEDVRLEDIAHSLSQTNRFCGHTNDPYSVGQHALLVSMVAENFAAQEFHCRGCVRRARTVALWGLHHDDSEAYICDLVHPVKRAGALGEYYRETEHRLMDVIAQAFLLGTAEPPEVKRADVLVCNTEMRDLMNGDKTYRTPPRTLNAPEFLGVVIQPLPAKAVEAEYLRRHIALILALESCELSQTIH